MEQHTLMLIMHQLKMIRKMLLLSGYMVLVRVEVILILIF